MPDIRKDTTLQADDNIAQRLARPRSSKLVKLRTITELSSEEADYTGEQCFVIQPQDSYCINKNTTDFNNDIKTKLLLSLR